MNIKNYHIKSILFIFILTVNNSFCFKSINRSINRNKIKQINKYVKKTDIDYKKTYVKNSKMNHKQLSNLDDWMMRIGLRDDHNITKEEGVDTIIKIKESGTAGIVSYAITEGGFWLISIPFSFALATFSSGTIPNINTQEGINTIGGYSLALLAFARTIVPLRIALALAITPWVSENIIIKFNNQTKVKK